MVNAGPAIVDGVLYVADFSGIAAGGVNAAYQSSHAGTRDVAHRDVALFEIPDHTDMR